MLLLICYALFCYLPLQGIAGVTGAKSPGAYQPDYTRCADHFLLHAGGYAILRGIQKGLRLPADKMLPSFASLRDFGNTSSASTWYTWSYIEATMGVKKNETILQVHIAIQEYVVASLMRTSFLCFQDGV
jgi:hypothetical protein